jgi:hypothetical protein
MRASAWMAATGVEPADQSCLGKIYQCGGSRGIPQFRPTALDMAQPSTSPRLPLRISEVMPATAPRAARGRADAGEAVGCTAVATTKSLLRLLRRLPPPHTHTHTHISYPTTCSYVKKIRPLANHNDFVSERLLAEKTLLVGYWNHRMLRNYEVRNR